ncbi:MAG: peptide MFS transporter [Pseudomonadota bacterium]|nr:peptide MFS transporter [Pseudomonadota bacterium]
MTTYAMPEGPEWFGHPRGLFVCFATEMWERFSYYGMKYLLVLFLVQHHLFTDGEALRILGAYAALVYAMPLLGGIVSDRFLGQTKAIKLGGVLLVLGHCAMAFEGAPASQVISGEIVRDDQAITVFYFALALIIVGVGLLKPNISTLVGRLYGENDPRRDGGFTIFYMGINIGAASASLLCGWLASAYGWAYGFGAAGIGMLIGLIVFSLGQDWLEGHGDPADPAVLQQPAGASFGLLNLETTISVYSILSVFVISVMLQQPNGVGLMLPAVAAVFLAWFGWLLATQCDSEERRKMTALFFLIVISTVFWSMFEQSGGSMTLFADRATDLKLFGIELTAAQFGSANAIFIILLSPLFALMWPALLSYNVEPSTPAKFGLGIIQVGLGFGALLIGLNNTDSAGLVSAWWLVLAYFLHTSAELCLSPIGLSAVTKLSIARYVGVMMGAWFLASAYGSYLASELAIFFSSIGGEDGRLNNIGFNALFTELLIYGVGMGIAVLLVSPLVRRLMKDVR